MKKNMKSIFSVSLFVSSALLTSGSFADETFTQNGKTYVVKSGVVGVMNLSEKDTPKAPLNQQNNKSSSSSHKGFFKAYNADDLKMHGAKLANQKKYQVVYKQVVDANTQEVKEVPGLLTSQVIVKVKDPTHMHTSLKLKKRFDDSGISVYEIENGQSIAQALEEFKAQSEVESATVEVIEHLRVPM